jgi:hypothetical protein
LGSNGRRTSTAEGRDRTPRRCTPGPTSAAAPATISRMATAPRRQRRLVLRSERSCWWTMPHSGHWRPGVALMSYQQRGQRRRLRGRSPMRAQDPRVMAAAKRSQPRIVKHHCGNRGLLQARSRTRRRVVRFRIVERGSTSAPPLASTGGTRRGFVETWRWTDFRVLAADGRCRDADSSPGPVVARRGRGGFDVVGLRDD